MSQIIKADLLKSLHIKGNPLVLFNVWDAGSARAMQEVGAKAIATSSWSVAASHGFDDGEKLSFALVVENLQRIVKITNLPVTIDFEGGYGRNREHIQKNITKIIKAGAVGVNFEDQVIGEKALYSIDEQFQRIKAIHEVAEQFSIPIFINARTDIFLKVDPTKHNESHLAQAVHRSKVYADAGACGFFVPGLVDAKMIEKLCQLSPIPVNVMVLGEFPTTTQLAELGVARISYGSHPYLLAINALKEAGQLILNQLNNTGK